QLVAVPSTEAHQLEDSDESEVDKRQGHGPVSSAQAGPRKASSERSDDILGTHTVTSNLTFGCPLRQSRAVDLARKSPGGLDVGAHADRAIWLCGPAEGNGVVNHADIAWVADCLGVQDSRWCHGTVDGFSVCQPSADELDGRAQPRSAAPHVGRRSAQAPADRWPGNSCDVFRMTGR